MLPPFSFSLFTCVFFNHTDCSVQRNLIVCSPTHSISFRSLFLALGVFLGICAQLRTEGLLQPFSHMENWTPILISSTVAEVNENLSENNRVILVET